MKGCSICTHWQLEDINQDLLNGISVRKIAEKYGISHMAVQRHKAKHIVTVSTVTSCNDIKCNDMKCNDMKCNDMKCNDMKCNDMKCNDMDNGINDIVTFSNSQALGDHWKVIEEAGRVTLYFKKRVIPLEPYGNHYYDPKSKEEFKKDGNNWFLRIPYYKDGWANLDNVACFYE